MNKLKASFVFLIIMLMIGLSAVSAQNGKLGLVGKFFTQQEAKVLFGKVNKSLSIKAIDLRNALDGAKDYVLITLKNRIVIRDENGNRLSDENEQLGKNETLYIFSKSQVLKLINSPKNAKINNSVQAAAGDVFVELRESTLTLTAGETTLEYALPCPPVCAN